MRVCEEGAEGHVTHLVLGSPRRTLKVGLPLMPILIPSGKATAAWADGLQISSPVHFMKFPAGLDAHQSGGPSRSG